MTIAEAHPTQDDSAAAHGAMGEPSVASAIEHLVTSSQGVVTKRIDLALLEGQDLLSRTLQRAALVICAMVLAAGAWFAITACLVLWVTPNANPVFRLAAFGLLNAGGALGLVALAMRRGPEVAERTSGNRSSANKEP